MGTACPSSTGPPEHPGENGDIESQDGPPGPVGPRGLKGSVGAAGPTGMSQSPSPAGPVEHAVSCPEDYTTWRGICYKAFNTLKNFSDAAAACHEDGGTLAMPRDAETNDFLVSLYKSHKDERDTGFPPPLFICSLPSAVKHHSYNWAAAVPSVGVRRQIY
uniref:C-type lectin domain-containing protein n=1 Tax=Branchiostoma floridae TaxID=7739 RepID=C3XY83_BRAFL|eukprot:XP_002610758.1 hypothetical protein BRAFLDRAFT_91544 [Branchiostoma floridae]